MGSARAGVCNVVMLYGPRTDKELQIAKTVIAASYRYATGHALSATHNDQLSR